MNRLLVVEDNGALGVRGVLVQKHVVKAVDIQYELVSLLWRGGVGQNVLVKT